MQNSFSHVLHKLSKQTLTPQQMAILQHEHHYVEKLKQQRIKIQQLTTNHQKIEIQLRQKEAQCEKMRHITQQKAYQVESLIKVIEEQRIKIQSIQTKMNSSLIRQQQKYKEQIKGLNLQVDRLRSVIREKELMITTIKTEFERKIEQNAANYQQEIRQLTIEYEKKNEKDHKIQSLQDELSEYVKLVDRQSKALKTQDQECEHLISMNKELQSQICDLTSQIKVYLEEKNQVSYTNISLQQQVQVLQCELHKYQQFERHSTEIDQIRREMGARAKEEIEKIEHLMNQLK